MTTPRVTVPVEQPLVDWFSQFIERHQEGCGSDTDALIACLDRVRDSYQAPSAAPAPEGGEVSIWSDARNVFVRYAELFAMTERYEEASAIADKAAREIEALEASLIGDVGDGDCPTCQGSGLMRVEIGLNNPDATVETQPCDRCPGLNGARVRLANMARDIDMGLTPLAAWPYQLSNPTSATAKATAHDIGLVLSALRAQPPAREDAQPVAWRWKTPIQHVGDGTRWGWTFASHPSTPPASINPEPLYTHPAPDALREAVESLEWAIAEIKGDTRYDNKDQKEAALEKAQSTLAALQAEQKGGAA